MRVGAWTRFRCRLSFRRRVFVPHLGIARRLAFSVVELVVVAGLIGVLVSLIVPSLSMAREQAFKAVCGSNLRQLGVGLKTYASEQRGWYPIEDMCGNPQAILVRSLFARHVPQRDVYYCPSASKVEPYAQSNEYGGPGGDSIINTDENWARSYISYKYFSVTRRDTRMPLPLTLSEYPHLLREDSPPTRWLMSDWVRSETPVFPHRQKGGWGGGRNVLFTDTSVSFVRHRTPGAFGGIK